MAVPGLSPIRAAASLTEVLGHVPSQLRDTALVAGQNDSFYGRHSSPPEYWYVREADPAYENNYLARFAIRSGGSRAARYRIRRGVRPHSGGPPASLAGRGADRSWGVPPSPHQRGLRPLWTLPPGGKPFAWLGLRCPTGPLLRYHFSLINVQLLERDIVLEGKCSASTASCLVASLRGFRQQGVPANVTASRTAG